MNKNCLGKPQHWLLLLLLSFSSILSIAQGYNTTNWRFSNPRQFGFTVTDVDFVDDNNVIAVGTDGGIAKSTDAGATWTYGAFTYISPAGYITKPSFSDVHYVTPSVAYAVGIGSVNSGSVYQGGVLAKTSDGGATWSAVSNPLFTNRRGINTVWFINKDTGYIAGQWNTPDSIPKLYFTKNGGATWDSLASPIGGKTRMGYVNNVNAPAIITDVTGKGKEIHHIEFTSFNTGYVIGSGQSHFPAIPAVSATTCALTGGTTSTSANNAALVWKYSNGVLTDYSLSKERLGFSGIVTNTIACNTQYNAAQIAPVVQTYKAMCVINDSLILLTSFNNNIVLRVYTGKNDSTVNLINGLKEPGRYELLSFPFPPTQGPNAQPPIPNPNTFLVSNPLQMRRSATSGKILMPGASPVLSPENRVMVTLDTGRTWTVEKSIPAGRNYSAFGTQAIDIAPGGKVLVAGNSGVVSDSIPGSVWKSTYSIVAPGASYSQIEFADCANGMVSGGTSITVTTDAGATWVDKGRPDFAASFYTINGIAYPTVNKSYFAVSNGILYGSTDQGTTLDPLYANSSFRMTDVAAVGKDSVWAVAASAFTVASALRTSAIFKSTDGGLTWSQATAPFAVGTLSQALTEIEFPSRQIGYACGNRDTIWKTTDAGATWVKLPLPTPGVTPQITYSDMVAVDDNVVYVTGNGFPRKVVFKTTDGGATWTDVTSNALSLKDESNIFGLMFHDANNGYIAMGSGSILKTTNGGSSWTIDFAPSAGFNAIGFAPRKVPAGINMQNRKTFVVGPNYPIMEYGTTANVSVNSSEALVGATCTNPTGGSVTITASGGLAPYTYSINGGTFQTSPTFTGLTGGTKTITIKDAFCGILTKTITIPFTDNLTVAVTPADTTVCVGTPVQLTASTNGTGATYSWTPTSTLSATNIANPIANGTVPFTYTVTASLNGCVRTTTARVLTRSNPTVDAGLSYTIVEGDQVTLHGSVSGPYNSFTWSPTNSIVTGGNTFSPTVQPSATTQYVLTAKDAFNCIGTDNTLVTVLPKCFEVLNAFTPNGDGINDKWKVTNGSCAKEIKVEVYNRYGNVVFKSNGYSNDWDGTYNGKPVPDGTYYYAVTYITITGKTVVLKGDVTILR